MLGFFSKEKDLNKVIKKEDIYFVSCSDKLSNDQIKMNFSRLAKEFAEKFDLKEVYLHFGKDLIIYEFEV